jgi:hypothetical protein
VEQTRNNPACTLTGRNYFPCRIPSSNADISEKTTSVNLQNSDEHQTGKGVKKLMLCDVRALFRGVF